MRVEPDAQPTRRRDFGKSAAYLERIGDLAAEEVDQDGERVVREGLMVHLGGAQRAAGIADQCVRHGAEAGRLAEIMCRGVGRVADEALGPGLALGARRAHRGGIGHLLGHVGPGAVARVHGEEARIGQVGAHRVGIVGGDAGRPQALQEHGLQIDQMAERAVQVHQGLAGTDPSTLLVHKLDIDHRPALGRDALQPVDGQAGRRQDRSAHEYGIGHLAVAEALDDGPGAREVFVGVSPDLALARRHRASFRWVPAAGAKAAAAAKSIAAQGPGRAGFGC